MSERTLSTLRAVDGICLDAMMSIARVVSIPDPRSDDALKALIELNIEFAKQLREIHMLVRDELEQIDK